MARNRNRNRRRSPAFTQSYSTTTNIRPMVLNHVWYRRELINQTISTPSGSKSEVITKEFFDRESLYQGQWIRPFEAAFGAIPYGSCAINKITFNTVVYQPRLVAEYLDLREGLRAARKVFTVSNPHKCSHCQRNGIDGMALARGQRLFPLDYHLGDAIIAAASGCALYEWVLYNYKGLESLEKGSDVRFWLRIGPAGVIEVYANNFIRDVGELELMELDHKALMWVIEKNTNLDLRVPYERDVGSTTSFQFAQEFLQNCLSEHAHCRESWTKLSPDGTSRFPTRLIRILKAPDDDTNSQIRLVETEPLTSLDRQGYATISYCWGGEQHKQLTKADKNSFEQGFSYMDLPKTLQNAITVTRSLELEYVWIDTLCIIQDDPSDVETELGRMSDYYSGSTVTICAASAAKCSEGFLQINGDSDFLAGPFQIPLRTEPGKDLSSVQLFVPAPLPVQPIAKRAWTFQESMLSRRLLIYTSRQLYWSCLTYDVACRGVEIIDAGATCVPGIQPLSLVRQRETPYQPPSASSLFSEWSAIVKDYSKRELSFPHDKLIAISALAQYFATIFSTSTPQLEYLAGLWKFEDHAQLRRQLLWRVPNPSASKRSRTYRAPSWSWACLDGDISYLPDPFGHNQFNFEEMYPYSCYVNKAWKEQMSVWEGKMSLDVLGNYGVELTSNHIPFGAVNSGFIQVRGAMRNLDPNPKPEKPKKKWYKFKRSQTPPPPPFVTPRMGPAEGLVLSADTQDDRQIIDTALAGQRGVFMLELVPYKPAPSLPGTEPETPSGLLLVPTGPASSDEYRRIGIFYFRHEEHNSRAEKITAKEQFNDRRDGNKVWLPEGILHEDAAETEKRRSARLNLFYGRESRTVKIV